MTLFVAAPVSTRSTDVMFGRRIIAMVRIEVFVCILSSLP